MSIILKQIKWWRSNMIILYYPKCSTCKKALQYLDALHLDYEKRDIVLNHPSKEELKHWQSLNSKPLTSLFNVNGKKYRELQLKTKLPFMDEDEIYTLLASDGMLIKRPLVILDHQLLIGFKEKEWTQALKNED